jgi:hypothetical protein
LAKKGSTDEVASEPPKPRAPRKSEQYLDACTLAAEYRGISIEELFKREPERYKQYCRLVLEEQVSDQGISRGAEHTPSTPS